MRHIDLPIKDYYGVDIVPRMIQGNELRFGGDHRRFTVADLTRDTLPRAEPTSVATTLTDTGTGHPLRAWWCSGGRGGGRVGSISGPS